MFKKVVALVAILTFVLSISFSNVAFAAPKDKEPSYEGSVEDTDQFDYIKISRPESDEVVFKKSGDTAYTYVVSGYTEEEDLRISLFTYDKEKDKYVPFRNVDKEFSWRIGKSGIFGEKFKFTEKETKLLFVAVKISNLKKDPKDSKEQRRIFKITVEDESDRSKYTNNASNASEIIEYVSNKVLSGKSANPTNNTKD